MGRAIDETGIQFRVLNTKKGPAVRASRAQADKALYRSEDEARPGKLPWLDSAARKRRKAVSSKEIEVKGVETQIGEIFLGRQSNIDDRHISKRPDSYRRSELFGRQSGRFRSPGIERICQSLGFKVGRLKTGTCPRLDSTDNRLFSACSRQHGDKNPVPFSFSSDGITQRQVPCHITYTNKSTHEIIRCGDTPFANVFRSDKEPRAALLSVD